MRINVVDLETYGDSPVIPYCMGIMIDGHVFFVYGRSCVRRGLIEIFKRSPRNSVYYAHNLTFDGLLIIENMGEDFEIERSSTFMLKGNIYSLGLRYKSTHIVFRCSYRLFPLGLREVAPLLGVVRKGDLDHDSINADNFMSRQEEVKAYCRRDLQITSSLLHAIDKAVRDLLPNWSRCISISSLALKLFKTYEPKFVLSLPWGMDNAIRLAFYGGRCEVFGNPEKGEKIFHYDFSGMYTNRLLEALPLGLPEYVIKPKDVKTGFYSVRVRSEGFDIPILPYRDPETGRLLFPNGVFDGVYWSSELKLFLSRGGKIEEIYWGYEFENLEKSFYSFASECKKRRGVDGFVRTFWKAIPNSLVGRLGLRPITEHTSLIGSDRYDPFAENIISDKQINSSQYLVRYRKALRNPEFVEGNVMVPAAVTSEARCLWWLASEAVIKNGGRILYCDTDSIYASFSRDVRGETHGPVFWDPYNKDTYIKDAVFATSKAYTVITVDGTLTKIKGVYKNSLSFEEFKNHFDEKKSVELTNLEFSKAKFTMKRTHKIKHIDLVSYKKRLFNASRTRTTPLSIYPR